MKNRKGFRWVISGSSLALLALSAPLFSQTSPKAVPLVIVSKNDTRGLLLGASQGKTWLPWKKTHALIKGGETYTLYGALNKSGQKTGKKPLLSQASGDAYFVALSKLAPVKASLLAFSRF